MWFDPTEPNNVKPDPYKVTKLYNRYVRILFLPVAGLVFGSLYLVSNYLYPDEETCRQHMKLTRERKAEFQRSMRYIGLNMNMNQFNLYMRLRQKLFGAFNEEELETKIIPPIEELKK